MVESHAKAFKPHASLVLEHLEHADMLALSKDFNGEEEKADDASLSEELKEVERGSEGGSETVRNQSPELDANEDGQDEHPNEKEETKDDGQNERRKSTRRKSTRRKSTTSKSRSNSRDPLDHTLSPTDSNDNNASESQLLDKQNRYAALVIDLALRLEGQARQLLIDSLPAGSKEQTLLRADLYVQARDVQSFVEAEEEKEKEEDSQRNSNQDVQKPNVKQLTKNLPLTTEVPKKDVTDLENDLQDIVLLPPGLKDTLDSIGKYRQTFAALLAAGSRLRGLEGKLQYQFERRRYEEEVEKRHNEDHLQKIGKGAADGVWQPSIFDRPRGPAATA